MKKPIAIITLIFLLAPLFAACLPAAHATYEIIGYSAYNDAAPIHFNPNYWVGYNVTLPAGTWYVNNAHVRFSQATTGYITFVLMNSTGDIIYTQGDIYVTAAAETVGFNFTEVLTLTGGALYWLGAVTNDTYIAGTSGSAASKPYRDTTNDYSTPTDPDDMTYYSAVTCPAIWLIASSDILVPETTPGVLPTGGSYDTSDTDAVINTLSGYLVPLLTFLVPALLMGYLTHWAKWPIMIGLAIGSGLTYLFLGTAYVWLVFLVIIGIIGMAYQSVRGGGDIK